MQPDQFADIDYTLDADGIVTVRMNTPKRKNALSGLTALELKWAARHFQEDDDAHAMILTGANDPEVAPERQAFCSGAFFRDGLYDDLPKEIVDQIDPTDIALKGTVLEFFRLDKPVLAALNGLAIGGGFTLPFAVADQVYLSEHAWVRLPFASLGISPELGSTFLMPMLMGLHKAKEIFFYGDRLEAQTVVDLDLANAVLTHDELMPFVRDRALQLIPPRGAGAAIRQMKRILHTQRIDDVSRALDLENEALNALMAGEDFVEGVVARMQKRDPVFKGR